MKNHSLVWLGAPVLMLCSLCMVNADEAPATPDLPAAEKLVDLNHLPLPAGLPEFGVKTETSLGVAVYGQVNRPGIYHLPAGATVGDAIENAQGIKMLFWWGNSYILRPVDAGHASLIYFRSRNKDTNRKTPLQQGDRLSLGFEVY